jgi:hypothetical protein
LKQLRTLILASLTVLLAVPVFGQTTTTGGVSGLIADPQGAVLFNATVMLTNDATGNKLTTKTTKNGTYHFDLVPPGDYTILVSESGFTKSESKVTVQNSQITNADLKLTLGSDQQTVDVAATGTLLQAENSNVATTISSTQMTEVPNSGNNLLFETKITPGFNTGFGVVGSTLYQIDGENFNDPYNNANNSGASNLTLGLDDIAETTVTANGYSGQIGGLVGATVSFTSKSGGNRFHGDANWFWTGRSLVANTFAHKENGLPFTPRSFENANQWAAQISGPVILPHLFNGTDKLFFLADAEGLRAILPASPTTVLLPSANLQAYTLATLANNGLSASVPFYQNIFNIYNAAGASHGVPVTAPGIHTGNPNGGSVSGIATGCGTLNAADAAALGTTPGACTNYYQSTATTYANEALEIFRGDYIISDRDKFFIRYEHDDGVQPTTTDPVSPTFNAISIQPQHDGQFNETHTFGSKATNNFILAGLWYGALFGPSNLPATLAVFPYTMSFSDGSFTTLGGSDSSFPTGRNITTIQVQDDFALSQGNHTIKFGGKGYFIKENDHYFTAGTVPAVTVSTESAFIHGGVDPATNKTTAYTQSFPLRPNYGVQYDQWAAYAQDDWKATPSLLLNLALRVEHQGTINCIQNCITQLASPFLQLSHSVTIPYNQAYTFNQKSSLPGFQSLEWQPRIGFAYNPRILNQSLVLRGGYGLFYDGLAGSILEGLAKNPLTKNTFSNITGDNLANTQTSNLQADAAALNTAFANGIPAGGTVASIKASLPNGSIPGTINLQKFFTPPSVYTLQPNLHNYYVQKWNLEMQKQFGQSFVVSVNYLGNRGEHKPFTNAGLNAYSAAATPGAATSAAPFVYGLPTTQPDARFGTVYYYQSGGNTNYNGVIVSATYKWKGGSVITGGYTYGKTLDTGSNGFSTSTATGTTDIGSPVDPYNPLRNYGPSATDERHNFVMNYVYKLPIKNPYYGGWEVSGVAYAYSGLPFTAIDTAASSSIASYASGAYGGSLLPTYLGGGEGTCGYGKQVCLTKSEFTSNPTGAANVYTVDSNNPRNSWRGPMYVSTDLSVTKSLPVHWEGGRFEASAQAFNVLNHLNFSKPTGSFSSSSFGTVTSTLNPSGIFSGVGGDDSPRILQLKAKIVF